MPNSRSRSRVEVDVFFVSRAASVRSNLWFARSIVFIRFAKLGKAIIVSVSCLICLSSSRFLIMYNIVLVRSNLLCIVIKFHNLLRWSRIYWLFSIAFPAESWDPTSFAIFLYTKLIKSCTMSYLILPTDLFSLVLSS